MNSIEKRSSEFSKCHTQSHLNNLLHDAEVTDSYTACTMSADGHHRSVEKTDHHEVTSEGKEIDTAENAEIGDSVEEGVKEEEEQKREIEVVENVEPFDFVRPIQNGGPMSSQKDALLFNYFSKMDDKAASKSMDNWECERSLPWSRTGEREQNLSVPMFLYMLNNDIKSAICDLDQKEQEACRAHKWDEALRLRGMKNKLKLTREHQLLNAVGLEFDERARFGGMKSISERQEVIDKREKLISDGNLYSEEAKELWKKWIVEDEELEKKSSFAERSDLMQTLENEWKVLADEDKERIAHLYGKSKPDLLTEHHHKRTKNYPPN